MARICMKKLFIPMACMMICVLMAGCLSRTPAPEEAAAPEAETTDAAALPDAGPTEPLPTSGDEFTVDPESVEMGAFFEEEVDNFIVLLDASASKFLPNAGETKLKTAKDILRRFNAKTPDRPLFGGLRRMGWEAGAFSTDTSLLYGMAGYQRGAYADAIEKVRWAGGKTPLSKVMDKASDDLGAAPDGPRDYLAMVIISDGKVLRKEPDPVMAARRAKERYGERICIYTVAVGDDLDFETYTPEDLKPKYRRKYQLLQDIATEGKCGYMVRDRDLAPDKNMEQFVHDVFHRGNSFECPDTDDDGICDADDKCPGTPLGAPVDENGCWILGKVQFDLNKWNIRPEYHAMLDGIARVLTLNPDVRLAVQGHTCTIWTEDYNMKLSHWRAMAVAAYLRDRGARPEQLAVEGYGFTVPTAPNETERGRILNRRAEFQRIQ